MKLHYLDPQAVSALRLSPDKVGAKLRSGWQWHKLTPSFCAAGGTASYSRALISPEGDIAYVSDRGAGPSDPADLAALPVLEVCHRMVRLNVPFAEKDAAKALGAVWVGHKRTWACAPIRAGEFDQWRAQAPSEFDMMDDVSSDSAEAADQNHSRPRPG